MAVAAAPVALVPGSDDAVAAKERKGLELSVVTTSQRRILAKRRIRISVRATRSGTYRVFGSTRRRPGKRRARIVATRAKELRLGAGRTRTVRLRLIRAGRRELRTCVPRKVIANGLRLRGEERVPGRTRRRAAALRVNAARCRRDGSGGGGGTPSPPRAQEPIAYETENAGRCDFIDDADCLFPWPNDHFTAADPTTDTGRRLNLKAASMPANRAGKGITPGPYNRNDGFSPGALIVTKVPGLETQKAFDETGAVPITDMEQAFAPRQPVVVLNARTRERQLIWAEIDSNAAGKNDVTFLIRPGVNFEEGERYIVALRNLKGEDGKTLKAPEGFRIYRDRVLTTNPDVEARRGHFESLFGTLAEAGIDRDSLYRAWDFTVASERNLSERVLAIRDDAFAKLGDTNLTDMTVQGEAPDFTIEKVTANPEDQLALRVEGRYTVPCYLNTPNCVSGGTFTYPQGSTNGPPVIPEGSTTTARFQCNIPKSATVARRITAVALRPRPARQPRRGEPGPAAGLRARAQLHLLRDGLDRHGVLRPARHGREPRRDRGLPREGTARAAPELRLPDGARDPERHVELPAARRPRAAGARQLPLPRAADDPPGRLLERPELPGERPEPDRHAQAVLRRQQPGRDHRRRPHRGRGRPRPRCPRRARDELLDALDAQHDWAPDSSRASSTCRSTRGSCTRRIRTSSSAS